MKPISLNDLEKMHEKYLANPKYNLVRRALYKNDLANIARVMEADVDTKDVFSIDIKTLPVTNQLRSGRCWIFAACNVMREKIAKKYKLENFELSQNYLAFYDKLEKINYFLEVCLNELDADLSSETMRYLLSTGIGDGGQWNMLVSLVKKYGIVPKNVMVETYQSSHTSNMNNLINIMLRKFAAESKRFYKENKIDDLNKLKEKTLSDAYSLLCNCFGIPPKSFTFEYTDKDGKYHSYKDISPKDFYKDFLDYNLDDYIGIINGPTSDKPFHNMYTVKYLGNVVDGEPISFLNLPMDEFKDLVVSQMKDMEMVWFGCDAGKFFDKEEGIWDDKQFSYDETLDIDFSMTKEDLLDSLHSAMNHAMCFTGVNLVDDKPNRFKIENSWGSDIGRKGYFVCSDSWFDKYVYQAVVNKKYLSDKQKEALNKKPLELLPWDPFGTLA